MCLDGSGIVKWEDNVDMRYQNGFKEINKYGQCRSSLVPLSSIDDGEKLPAHAEVRIYERLEAVDYWRVLAEKA